MRTGGESRERLVEDQHRGLVDEGRRELHALPVAERQRIHAVAAPLAHPEPLDPAVGGAGCLRRPGAVQVREVDELLVHSHARVQAALLWHVAEALAGQLIDRSAVQPDAAAVGRAHP
jgi:hypothetical protein